ncbi:MAG: hypothetical protein Kow0092_37010 [Deferrisomatales bacterium]
MTESKVLSTVEKGLFVKLGLLTFLVVALTVGAPAAKLIKAGAHRICQTTWMSDSGCPTA